MDPSYITISSLNIAETPEASATFIYESRSGRVFFFQRKAAAYKDGDCRYCPVCGNLRKACAANDESRQRLNALLRDACLQEIREQTEPAPPVDGREPETAATFALKSSLQQAVIKLRPAHVVEALNGWEERTAGRQQEGIFLTSRSRGPPRA